MSTNDSLAQRLLTLLLGQRDCAVSGEALSSRLGVTRAAVWKAVTQLRSEGYEVESATNRGYRLLATPNLIIAPLVGASIIGESKNRLVCLQQVDSTNLYANRLLLDGAEDGTVVIAESQTSGAGRLGRSFLSEPGVGVYLSMIIQLNRTADGLGMLTSYAGLAVCQAIEGLCGVKPAIKWPNDIVLDGKKVCGILTRLASDAETNTVTHAIVGIGINVLQSGFEGELAEKATSLRQATGCEYPRAALAGGVISNLNRMRAERWLDSPPAWALQELRERSCTIGKQVSVLSPTETRLGTAVDIDSGGELLVRFGDSIEKVFSGEVSVRGILGYMTSGEGKQ